MSRRCFILRCKRTLNDCTRLLTGDAGPGVFESTLLRLETMQRSLQWARGRLLNVSAADQLLEDLNEYIQEVQTLRHHGQQSSSGSYRAPLIWSGGRGAPHYCITREQLCFLRSCGFSVTQMDDILHVSQATVKRRLRQFNLACSVSYAEMSNSALDETVRDIVAGNERIGPEAVRAQLLAVGIRVQRHRIRQSIIRVNPRAAALRAMSQGLHRRSYCVGGLNSLWHLDGNHKLIRWRIVIHGGIDGYSRLIVFLCASNNNRSNTVLQCFLDAVAKFGVPSRVRTDHGGENIGVCLFMNIFRGSGRGSALRGPSTHNQRIERLWGDMWRGLTNVYHDLFSFLETEGILNLDNEMHLWALHYVYLPRINRDLSAFASQWNNHGLRTERHQSPLQIFVRGCLEQQSRPSTAMQDIFEDLATTTSAVREASLTEDVPDDGIVASVPEMASDAGMDHSISEEEQEQAPVLDWPERVVV
uniref:Integrase core domain-containing protein n=1 Tax=Astyanax mexicanus TaxID=7994 RepID=A0A3B1JIP5_ASTMX